MDIPAITYNSDLWIMIKRTDKSNTINRNDVFKKCDWV